MELISSIGAVFCIAVAIFVGYKICERRDK